MMNNLKNDWKDLRDKTSDTAKTGWFAGMGVLSRAENAGRELFDDLVKEGKNKKRSRTLVEKAVEQVETTGGKTVDRVSDSVKGVSGFVMDKAGVPSRDQLDTLIERVDKLSKQLDEKAS